MVGGARSSAPTSVGRSSSAAAVSATPGNGPRRGSIVISVEGGRGRRTLLCSGEMLRSAWLKAAASASADG